MWYFIIKYFLINRIKKKLNIFLYTEPNLFFTCVIYIQNLRHFRKEKKSVQKVGSGCFLYIYSINSDVVFWKENKTMCLFILEYENVIYLHIYYISFKNTNKQLLQWLSFLLIILIIILILMCSVRLLLYYSWNIYCSAGVGIRIN